MEAVKVQNRHLFGRTERYHEELSEVSQPPEPPQIRRSRAITRGPRKVRVVKIHENWPNTWPHTSKYIQ
jgi:hypothetical protein